MKNLALSIGGTPVAVPTQINAIDKLQFQDLTRFGLNFLIFAAIILSLLFLLFGGFRWMLSQGDKKGIDESRKTITYALGGLVLVLLSIFIINLIGHFLFPSVKLLGI